MPEPHHRCAVCRVTLADHEDPQVEHCSSFRIGASGGAMQDLAAAVRTVGQDGGRPIQVVLFADARRALAMAHEAGLSEGRSQIRAAHAETLENWGAFDYELLLLAERHGVDPELPPLEIVTTLMDRAMHEAAQTISESRPWGL